MIKKYLDQLESDTIQLVLLIETHIDREIVVREVPMRNNLGCEIENTTILVPENKFPDSSVLHELLHIRRFIVDNVPQLVVCNAYNIINPKFESSVTKLDNNIEHLYIVPEELSLRPNRRTYWENSIKAAIKNQVTTGLDVSIHGFDAVINYVFAKHIFAEGSVVEEASEVVSGIKCQEIAMKLLSALQQPNCNKKVFSRECLAELNLPRGSICFRYTDREERI